MSSKKRFLRIGCVTLLVLAFVGYFAFSTFFFPPHGGRVKFDLAGLIPRDVDVYLSREDLAAAFDDFPRLAVWDEIQDNTAVSTFMRSKGFAELDGKHGLRERYAEIQTQLDQIPLGLDPLGMIGGKDVALAADFTGRTAADSEWAVYARASFVGKLGASLLKYPGLIGLEAQGIAAELDGDVVTLTGPNITAPVHVTRVKDVVIAGTSRRLVMEAARLENVGAQGSLMLAAPYDDGILTLEGRDEKRRDIEIKLDLRKMREAWGMTKPWPDPNSDRFAPSFVARVLPVAAVRQLFGVIDFDQGLRASLSGTFSSELMSPEQETIYRAKGFSREELEDVAGLAPADCTMFAYMRGPIGTLAREVEKSLEPAARENLNATVQRVNGLSGGTNALIDLLDGALVDRVAFFARPNDWPDRPRTDLEVDEFGELILDENGDPIYVGPPRDGREVFAWTMVAWASDPDAIDELQKSIGAAGAKIGLQGRNPGDKGYFDTPIAGGLKLNEFWSQLIPGTGHIALLIYGDRIIVSNRYQFVEQVTQNVADMAPPGSTLDGVQAFRRSLDKGLPSANIALWLNPESGADLIESQARESARGRLFDAVDLGAERPRAERRLLGEMFPGKGKADLTRDEQDRLSSAIDSELILFREMAVSENLPRELRAVDEFVTYLRAIQGSLTQIRLDPREFRFFTETITPYAR